MILTMLLLFNYDKLRVPILIMTIMFPLKKMDLIPYKPYIQTIRPSTAQLGVPHITSHDAPCKWSRRVFSETPNAHVGYHLFLGLSPITLPQMLR